MEARVRGRTGAQVQLEGLAPSVCTVVESTAGVWPGVLHSCGHRGGSGRGRVGRGQGRVQVSGIWKCEYLWHEHW